MDSTVNGICTRASDDVMLIVSSPAAVAVYTNSAIPFEVIASPLSKSPIAFADTLTSGMPSDKDFKVFVEST